MFNQTISVALCAAALSLCATVQAQWPIRYNNSSFNGDDEAFAVAVDRRGNVYTAGKSWNGSAEKFDFVVDSYDAAGFRRPGWPVGYRGPGNGDDIPTSIHVDPSSGNVYVGGTSYGGTVSGFDFCVIAYNSNGIPIWPASGSAGTGYVYHNGSIRSTSADDEGGGSQQGNAGTAVEVHVAMAVREDLSGENRTIAMTGIVAKIQLATEVHYWRTVAFQPGSSAPYIPALKAGWPVDLKTVVSPAIPEIPEAVAIYSDNSVYVTGMTTNTAGQLGHVSDFTTVRYKATGSLNTTTPTHWVHQWHLDNNKLSTGMDIVLDRVGDAYATGTVSFGNTLDYGTICIRKDADSGGMPQVKWSEIWPSAAEATDVGRSISLTFEVENGTLVPYAFVTGSAGASIGTLRYRGDTGGLQFGWPQLFAAGSSSVGYDVVGAGYGNAYVVGRANDNLVALGYRRDGTGRFSPVVYDNNGFDEGRMGVMLGAGAPGATGASDGNLRDFVTQTLAQATTASSPSGYSLPIGLLVSGTVANLASSDDQYLVFKDNPTAEDVDPVLVEFTGTTSVNNPTEICVYHEGRTASAPMAQRIEVWDWLVGGYLLVDLRDSTTVDSRLVLVLKDDPSRFLGSGGVFKLRFRYTPLLTSDEVTYSVYFDQLTWEVLGQ